MPEGHLVLTRRTSQAVDLGAVMKSGARSFLGKLRRGSNTSTTSTSSNGSASTPNRGRSDSAPGSAPTGVPAGARATSSRDRVAIAPPLPEEPEDAGDETPRRGRSPSPTRHAPHTHHHFERSPSPPRAVFHEEDTDTDGYERHTTDDAHYELMRHRSSTEAALGFEMANYAEGGRPALARSYSEA